MDINGTQLSTAQLEMKNNTKNEEPDIETLKEWLDESGCEATDGCWVEPDGICEHGCKSWLLELGLI